MSNFTTDENGIETLTAAPTGDGGQALNNNFSVISSLLSDAFSAISTLTTDLLAFLKLDGSRAMTGSLNMGTHEITNSGTITASSFVGPLTGGATLDLPLSGGTMSGAIDMGGNNITNGGTATLGNVTSSTYSTIGSISAHGGDWGGNGFIFTDSGGDCFSMVLGGSTAYFGNGNTNTIYFTSSSSVFGFFTPVDMRGNVINMNLGGGTGGGTLNMDGGSITDGATITSSAISTSSITSLTGSGGTIELNANVYFSSFSNLNMGGGAIQSAFSLTLEPQGTPPTPTQGGLYQDGTHLYFCADGSTWTQVI